MICTRVCQTIGIYLPKSEAISPFYSFYLPKVELAKLKIIIFVGDFFSISDLSFLPDLRIEGKNT